MACEHNDGSFWCMLCEGVMDNKYDNWVLGEWRKAYYKMPCYCKEREGWLRDFEYILDNDYKIVHRAGVGNGYYIVDFVRRINEEVVVFDMIPGGNCLDDILSKSLVWAREIMGMEGFDKMHRFVHHIASVW